MIRCPYCGTTSAQYEQTLEDHIAECRVTSKFLLIVAALAGIVSDSTTRTDHVKRAGAIADGALALMEADNK